MTEGSGDKVDRLEHVLRGDIRQLDGKLDLHTRTLIQRIDERFGWLDQKILGVDKKLDGAVETLDQQLTGVERRLSQKIDGKIDALSGRVEAGFAELKQLLQGHIQQAHSA